MIGIITELIPVYHIIRLPKQIIGIVSMLRSDLWIVYEQEHGNEGFDGYFRKKVGEWLNLPPHTASEYREAGIALYRKYERLLQMRFWLGFLPIIGVFSNVALSMKIATDANKAFGLWKES